jgi:hypothetical protein
MTGPTLIFTCAITIGIVSTTSTTFLVALAYLCPQYRLTTVNIMVVRVSSYTLLLHAVLVACWAVIVVTGKNYTSADYDNPTIGAELVNFRMETTEGAESTFACEDPGARCVFKKAYYSDVDFGDGQETSNVQGAVWAATVDSAVLTLGACTGSSDEDRNDCIVTCNANCTCDVTSPTAATTTAVASNKEGSSSSSSGTSVACTQVESRAPTVAPKTSPPVPAVCSKAQFNVHCPELMRSSLPAGIVNNYDCFNFCGGAWVSGCAFGSATCGNLDCDNKTAAGTATGEVFGCTKADLQAAATATSTNGGKKSSATLRSASWMTIMVLVFGVGISHLVL